MGARLGSTLNSGTLVAGGTTSGTLCRDGGTQEKGQWVVIYKPNPFIDDRRHVAVRQRTRSRATGSGWCSSTRPARTASINWSSASS